MVPGLFFIFFLASHPSMSQKASGLLTISFTHSANGKSLVLRDSNYVNAFGETYTVNKLKYYIGNLSVDGRFQPEQKYYLVDAAKDENSISLNLPAGNYSTLEFVVGVDSIDNCSGAQDGALDPLNNMFWTWNSGYIFFKLEGYSPSSGSDLNRIEHHIGGYKGENNVARKLSFKLPAATPIRVKKDSVTELIIENDLDKYWNAINDIRISELSACMSPGDMAKKIAANFPGMFSLKNHKQAP
jgi:hypothetical protein